MSSVICLAPAMGFSGGCTVGSGLTEIRLFSVKGFKVWPVEHVMERGTTGICILRPPDFVSTRREASDKGKLCALQKHKLRPFHSPSQI